jgi:uncharacterized protein (DUF427 family)
MPAGPKNPAPEIARNLSITHTVLASLKGVDCDVNDAVCALLTAATTLIEQGYRPEHRLEALNEFLAPTIRDWAQQRGPIEVTLQ